MSDSLVSVKSVNKTYQRGGEELVVLDDLSLEPMSEIFDLDSKVKAFETLRYKLIGNIETHA